MEEEQKQTITGSLPEHNLLQSTEIGQLAEALAKAQKAIKPAVKDAKNPFFKASYADLFSIWEACREALGNNGLSVIQIPQNNEKGITVITLLAHSSGEWIRGELTLIPTKADAQGVGSVITYARRYALAAMVGVAPEEDDAESAMDRGNTKPGNKPKPSPKKTNNSGNFSETTDLQAKIRKYAARVKKLNPMFGDSWLINLCGKYGGSQVEEIDDVGSLKELLETVEEKGKELAKASQ